MRRIRPAAMPMNAAAVDVPAFTPHVVVVIVLDKLLIINGGAKVSKTELQNIQTI
jgi:hypothetical protein